MRAAVLLDRIVDINTNYDNAMPLTWAPGWTPFGRRVSAMALS
jgi:hypothetical protein